MHVCMATQLNCTLYQTQLHVCNSSVLSGKQTFQLQKIEEQYHITKDTLVGVFVLFDKIYHYIYNIKEVLTKKRQDGLPPPESISSVYIETFLRNLVEGRILRLSFTLENLYYLFFIASILCGCSYKIGYEHGKHAKK